MNKIFYLWNFFHRKFNTMRLYKVKRCNMQETSNDNNNNNNKKNRKIWRKPIQYVIYALKSSYCLLFEWRHFYRAFVCGAVKKHYKFLLLWRYFRLFSLSHNSIIKKILFNGFSWIFSGGLALFFSFNFRVCC